MGEAFTSCAGISPTHTARCCCNGAVRAAPAAPSQSAASPCRAAGKARPSGVGVRPAQLLQPAVPPSRSPLPQPAAPRAGTLKSAPLAAAAARPPSCRAVMSAAPPPGPPLRGSIQAGRSPPAPSRTAGPRGRRALPRAQREQRRSGRRREPRSAAGGGSGRKSLCLGNRRRGSPAGGATAAFRLARSFRRPGHVLTQQREAAAFVRFRRMSLSVRRRFSFETSL